MATQQQQKSNQESSERNKQQQTTGSRNIQTQSGTSSGQTGQQRNIARREQSYPSPFSNSPFAFMRRFTEDMDRLFGDFGFGSGLAPSFGRNFLASSLGDVSQTLWTPQIEMFERDGQLVVRADLPGVSKDDVNVEITDDAITISGERRQEHEEKGEGYYRTERTYGSFYRQIPLPEGVSAEDAKATFNNGVLEITLKAPQRESRSRRLEISQGGSEQSSQQSQSRAQGSGR